jgi:hypothetical protein
MEKYRKFGDAATGVNPFIFTHKPTLLSTAAAALLFPLRCVLGLLLCLLLFVVDLLMHSARKFFIAGIVTPYLLFPLQSVLSQLFLFSMCNLLVRQRVFPRIGPSGGSVNGPAAGDVLLCNMQSPLDVFVLLGTGGLSSWRMPYCYVAYFCHNAPHVVHFGPNPFQRWKTLFHVLYSTTRGYLVNTVAETETLTVDLTSVQRQALKLGVPVVFFAEGTTTNGRGVLQFPTVKLLSPRVFLVSLRYTSPALNAIIDNITCGGKILFSWSALIGSGDSPLFPEALVTLHKDPVLVSSGPEGAVLTKADALDVREKLANGVSYGNRNVVCVPLQLQGRNKHDFAVYFHSFGKGATSEK